MVRRCEVHAAYRGGGCGDGWRGQKARYSSVWVREPHATCLRASRIDTQAAESSRRATRKQTHVRSMHSVIISLLRAFSSRVGPVDKPSQGVALSLFLSRSLSRSLSFSLARARARAFSLYKHVFSLPGLPAATTTTSPDPSHAPTANPRARD
jgi:hypothetical protein